MMASTVKNGIACLRKGNRRRREIEARFYADSVKMKISPIRKIFGCRADTLKEAAVSIKML